MPTYQEVKKQIAALEARAEQLRRQEAARVIVAIKAQIAEYGLKPSDLFGSDVPARAPAVSKSSPKRKALKAKYMDPVSKRTWSGHGKAPAWIKHGKREDYLIGASKAVPPVAVVSTKSSAPVTKKPAAGKVVKPKQNATAKKVVAKKKVEKKVVAKAPVKASAKAVVAKKVTKKARPATKSPASKTAQAVRRESGAATVPSEAKPA